MEGGAEGNQNATVVADCIGDKNCEACAFASICGSAVSFCADCSEYLCHTCARDHRRNKASRTHKILDGKEAPRDPKIFIKMKKLLICPDHSENEVTLKCVEHNVFLCTVCVAVNHRLCQQVVEVSKDRFSEYATEENKVKVLNTLENANKALHAFQSSKENSIKSLRFDAAKIKEDLQNYICALYNHLEELNMLLEQETETIMAKEIQKIEDSIKDCKELNVEGNMEMIELVLSYGNVLQQNIICEKLSKEADKLLQKSKTYSHRENVSLRFQKNTAFEKVESLGTICTSREPVMNIHPEGCNWGPIETSSDVLDDMVCVAQSCTTDKKSTESEKKESTTSCLDSGIKNKIPFLKSKVMTITKHDISIRDDNAKCCIAAIELLSSGYFALVDEANKKIKFLSKDYLTVSAFTLNDIHVPIDLCEPRPGSLAVIYDRVKMIDKYRCEDEHKTLVTDGQFPTKLYPISISKYKHDLAILFSDETRDTEKTTENDAIEVQIRYHSNGKIIHEIENYIDSDSDDIELKNTNRILTLGTDPEMFILPESSKVHCFQIDDDETFKQVWYYKSHKNNILKGAADVAADDEGNVYVCGRDSKNIHQISGKNFRDNRVLFVLANCPTALCVDSARRQVVVGCSNDNCVYVASLE